MPKTGRVIPFAFAIAAAASPALAAADAQSWTSAGPDGGNVLAVAHDVAADTLWAGTKAGVFKSTDGGAHWLPAQGDLPRRLFDGGSRVVALAAAPIGPPAVYAGVMFGGIFRTENGGATWQRMHSGIISFDNNILLPHPNVAGTVFASSLVGIFRSTDSGTTWTPLGRLPTTALYPAHALAAVPESTQGLCVGLGQGIVKTTDGGASWTHLGATEFGGWSIHVLTVDPARPGTIYAAGHHLHQLHAVWRSDDAGATWKRADSGLPAGGSVTALALDGSGRVHASVFGSGIFSSSDHGATWRLASSALPYVVARTLVSDPAPGGALFAAGEGPGGPGVFASTDGGESWVPRKRRLVGFELEDVILDPQASATLYVSATAGGVLKSVDGGASWQPANTGLGAAASRRSVRLAIDPQDSKVLYGALHEGFFRTMDGGAHWTQRGRPGFGLVNHLEVDPERAGWLLAGTSEGLYRSVDAGANWTTVPGELHNMDIGELVRHPSSSAVLYASAIELNSGEQPPNNGVFTSLDGGATWSRVTNFYLGPLAPDPRSPSALWAFASELVLRSTDGGRHWSKVGTLELARSSLAATAALADPLVPDRLYAAFGNGVQRSNDGGATWSAWDEGLLHHGALALAIDPGPPGRLYVATAGGGLATRLTTATTCAAGPSNLCLSDGRFRVEVAWKDFAGGSGSGTAMPLTADTGAFWFFANSNVELVVKVLDGRGLNGRYWVFYGSLTSVEFTLTVTDTSTGQHRTYHNPSGTLASVADTDAF